MKSSVPKMTKFIGAVLLAVLLTGCDAAPTPGPAGSKTLACSDTNYLLYSFHYEKEITWDNGKITFLDADTNKVRNLYNFSCYEVQE